jgi:sorbitol-specific phosphotransferase system component IIBC
VAARCQRQKVLSLTGREIHPVAIEIGALTESEIVNGLTFRRITTSCAW